MRHTRPAFAYALLLSLSATLALAACGDEEPSTGGAPDAVDDAATSDEGGQDVGDASEPSDSADSDASDAPGAPDLPGDTGPRYASEFTVVELDGGAHPTFRMAVRACAGLINARVGGSVYVKKDGDDAEWLEELTLPPSETVDAASFLQSCLAELPACVRYSYADQQRLLPNILTVAAVLEAVPLDDAMDTPCDRPVFDATIELADHDTPYLATKYAFENFVAGTTGLAMLNPGYDTNDPNHADPALNAQPRTSMVDFVFSEKLFVVFLINACGDPSPENEILSAVVNAGHWETPVGVYGYNNSWLVGGYLWEAQTTCLESRNMGAIPTETGNLSFFSTRRPPIAEPGELTQVPAEEVAYDPAKTYVAFVVGDGDNIRFMLSTRKTWLRQRLTDCDKPDNSCQPLTWSISPHLPHLAPDVLEWYYASALSTGNDYFTLPPSGHHYAYPTSLAEAEQGKFVTATEQDARLLGVQSVVHWDWFDTWKDAESDFLPKYATQDGAIRGILPINVPYFFETFPWWQPDEFYRVLTGADGGQIVVFRPRQWRGVTGADEYDPKFSLSPQELADEIAAYPAGTVTWVYMTSDGGLNLENAFLPLVKLLPEHVQLVSADAAAKLALDAAAPSAEGR